MGYITQRESAIQVVLDGGNRFGEGTANQVLEYRKTDAPGSAALILADSFSADLAKISFQYFQPDDENDGYSWILLYAGSRSVGNRAQVITIGRDGSLAGKGAPYERGKVYDVVLVVNNSSLPTVYGNNYVVPRGKLDIWIEGVRTHVGFSHQNNKSGPITGLEFDTAGNRTHHFYIDDLMVEKFEPRTVPVGIAKQPATHPPLTPVDGETVEVNPPPMVWQNDLRAASYILEIANDDTFADPIRKEVDLPFYNHSDMLEPGTWFWRHFVVAEDGEEMGPSPVRRFEVSEDAIALPIPPTKEILANLPAHPRVFTTPSGLEGFRTRHHGPAKQAWEAVEWQAEQQVGRKVKRPSKLLPLEENQPEGPTPGITGRWKKGSPVRRQVIWLVDGKPYVSPGYS